jgi:preprotein translocase subunit SecA
VVREAARRTLGMRHFDVQVYQPCLVRVGDLMHGFVCGDCALFN